MNPRTIKQLMVVAVFVTLFISPALHGEAPATRPGQVAIGVYDSRAVALAFVQSGGQDALVNDLRKQLEEAKAAGDTKRVEQIKAQGANQQTLRHLQGFSNAPVDDILLKVKDKLPAIAEQAGVDAIVAKLDYQRPGVVTVDVTDQMVALFHPSAKTLKTIAELRQREPVPMVQILERKD
jgi:hypothetical protein